MVICDTCALKDQGCVLKSKVASSGGTECDFFSSVTRLEKIAQNQTYTVSWSYGTTGKRITETHQGGNITSRCVE